MINSKVMSFAKFFAYTLLKGDAELFINTSDFNLESSLEYQAIHSMNHYCRQQLIDIMDGE